MPVFRQAGKDTAQGASACLNGNILDKQKQLL